MEVEVAEAEVVEAEVLEVEVPEDLAVGFGVADLEVLEDIVVVVLGEDHSLGDLEV